MSNSHQNGDIPVNMEVNLDDDKAPGSREFNGATLSLGGSNPAAQPTEEVEFKGQKNPPTSNTMPDMSNRDDGPGLQRDRPFSASTRSRMSTKSTTSMNPHAVQTNVTIKTYFSYRQGCFEAAVEHCEKVCLKYELDGDLKGAWLLSEIDHWDNEREKVVLLTDHSLLICRYDFIANKLVDHRRVMLHNIDTLTNGDLVYPTKSFMPPRNHGGIRISWAQGKEPTFAQKWNPMASDLGYAMFAHHPIIYHDKERETVTFNVDDFYDSLIQGVNQALRMKNPGQTVKVTEEPILIESYASLSSQIFNQSSLGFFKERGGVSF